MDPSILLPILCVICRTQKRSWALVNLGSNKFTVKRSQVRVFRTRFERSSFCPTLRHTHHIFLSPFIADEKVYMRLTRKKRNNARWYKKKNEKLTRIFNGFVTKVISWIDECAKYKINSLVIIEAQNRTQKYYFFNDWQENELRISTRNEVYGL